MRPLAHLAVSDATSRGRRHAEPPPGDRTEHQRDRDRIIHSSAFRRLEYKTQVFVNHEGDMFRTRLTHSLEVAQVCRSVARWLGLNEDLAEAVSLAHDLGHTPFGHAGQDALNGCMREHGGFEHNVQSLRIVDQLETRYAAFPGINLSFETREGILKHCTPDLAARLGEVAERFVHGGQPTLEAQLANLADEIAYNAHDLDDGLRAGMLDAAELGTLSALWQETESAVRAAHGGLPARLHQHEVIRGIIKRQIADLRAATQQAATVAAADTLADVRACKHPLACFSPAMRAENDTLKGLLAERVYRHAEVRRMTVRAGRTVRGLFEAYFEDPLLLPADTRRRATDSEARKGLRGRARVVADYVAGMTDRYALAQHAALHGTTPT
jgi:dGTPase